MARQSDSEEKDHFDLLPFIAILMCVLGCLLLVTMSIAALSIGPGVGEGWIPTNDKEKDKETSKIPRLVEWDGTDAVFHMDGGKKIKVKWKAPSNGGPSARELNYGDNNGGATFQSLLQDMALNRSTCYVLFAVRPEGFKSFREFAEDFRELGITIGYEPIKQGKSVRLLTRSTKK